MTGWQARNRWAFPVIVLMAVLIGTTVSYPAWSRNLGIREPAQVVPWGESADVDGITMTLTSVEPPPGTAAADAPPGSRLVTYVLERERDGRPAAMPEGFGVCDVYLTDGRRIWYPQTGSLDVIGWSLRMGWSKLCGIDGPLLVAMDVPRDAQITGAILMMRPAPPEADPDDGVRPYEESPLVIRFDTR